MFPLPPKKPLRGIFGTRWDTATHAKTKVTITNQNKISPSFSTTSFHHVLVTAGIGKEMRIHLPRALCRFAEIRFRSDKILGCQEHSELPRRFHEFPR